MKKIYAINRNKCDDTIDKTEIKQMFLFCFGLIEVCHR